MDVTEDDLGRLVDSGLALAEGDDPLMMEDAPSDGAEETGDSDMVEEMDGRDDNVHHFQMTGIAATALTRAGSPINTNHYYDVIDTSGNDDGGGIDNKSSIDHGLAIRNNDIVNTSGLDFKKKDAKESPEPKLTSIRKKMTKRRKKPADAPKRFRSSFIFFSMYKQKEIKDKLAAERRMPKSTNITKMVSEAWRNLDALDRIPYEEMAKLDKVRYDQETEFYTPPPGTSLHPKRNNRDPDHPKRPASAYVTFANARRAEVKARNPCSSNGEISKILSDMWKDTPTEAKQKLKEEEAELWAMYKEKMAEYRKTIDGRRKAVKDATARTVGNEGNLFDHIAGDIASGHFSSDETHQQEAAGFGDVRKLGFDATTGVNPNSDDMMAASALRGVRCGSSMVGGAANGGASSQAWPMGFGGFVGTNGMPTVAGGFGTYPAPSNGPVTGPPPEHGLHHMGDTPRDSGHLYQYEGFGFDADAFPGNRALMMAAQMYGTSNTMVLLRQPAVFATNFSNLDSLAGTAQTRKEAPSSTITPAEKHT